MPWVLIEFVIDGVSDWRRETSGALEGAWSMLICTASYRITAHTGPLSMWETVIIAFSQIDNDDDKLYLPSTYQVFRINCHNCLTARMESNCWRCVRNATSQRKFKWKALLWQIFPVMIEECYLLAKLLCSHPHTKRDLSAFVQLVRC